MRSPDISAGTVAGVANGFRRLARIQNVRTIMQLIRRCFDIARDSIERFNADDGWAIASHLALSTLMAMFPFLIVLAGLAGFVTTLDLADAVATLMLKTWPNAVSGPIADEVREVIRVARGSVLGTGIAFAVFFSSSGIESLRIGLNRAYRVPERRSWLLLRLESIAYVLIGAVVLLAFGFLIVLAPLIFATALVIAALVTVHKWLPAGRRRLIEIAPGVLGLGTSARANETVNESPRRGYSRTIAATQRSPLRGGGRGQAAKLVETVLTDVRRNRV